MRRLESLQTALEAAYAGADTTWLVGAEHIYGHQNWNRVVVYLLGGAIVTPDIAAQGVQLEDLQTPTVAGAIDDILWVRKARVGLAIWAANTRQAENRLHAMLIAVSQVLGDSDIEVSDLNETWIQQENRDVTSGGALVTLEFNFTLYVVSSDYDVVAEEISSGSEQTIGEGVPTETVDEVGLTGTHENEDTDDTIGTITIVEET